jgi:hypothetical protein
MKTSIYLFLSGNIRKTYFKEEFDSIEKEIVDISMKHQLDAISLLNF